MEDGPAGLSHARHAAGAVGARLSLTPSPRLGYRGRVNLPCTNLRGRAGLLRTVVAVGFALAAGSSWAALYKWTDANGRVVYSDQPPTGGLKYEMVGGAPPPDNPNAARDLANKEAELKKAQQDRADAEAKAGKARADAVKRADLCQQARAGVRMYSNTNEVLHTYNDKGEQVIIDDAVRLRRLAEQQRLSKEYCSG